MGCLKAVGRSLSRWLASATVSVYTNYHSVCYVQCSYTVMCMLLVKVSANIAVIIIAAFITNATTAAFQKVSTLVTVATTLSPRQLTAVIFTVIRSRITALL